MRSVPWRKVTGFRVLVALGVVIVAAELAFWFFWPNACVRAFPKIKEGMTAAEVQTIVGREPNSYETPGRLLEYSSKNHLFPCIPRNRSCKKFAGGSISDCGICTAPG
jgi:hypothetical protein